MCHMQSSASSKPASGRQFVPLASRLVRPASIFAALLLGAGIALRGFPSGAESVRLIPPPMLDEPANPQATAEVAILAGGCFWGVQGVFQHVAGVTSAISGYTGGTANTAHYGVVSTTTTGHAESVRVVFDPHLISYGRILQIYFWSHTIRQSSTVGASMSGANILHLWPDLEPHRPDDAGRQRIQHDDPGRALVGRQ